MPTVGGGAFTAADDGPTPVKADSSRATPATAVPRRAADLLLIDASLRMPVGGQWFPKERRGKTKMDAVTTTVFRAFLWVENWRQFQSKREQISGKSRSL